jgi:ribonuclease D
MTDASEIETNLRLKPVNDVLPVVNTQSDLSLAIERLMSGSGGIAIDAERASGFKYYQRAYLIQLYRQNSPIVLIDPIGLDLTYLANFLNEQDWILHAATQDLPCLNELGLFPNKLFDTELAAKLIGLPKVGLASLTESLLNISLAKEHSAVNWSIRPLSQDWLNYAALDVELLPELKVKLEGELIKLNRISWADQEFMKLRNFQPNASKPEQWRRTSGIHELPNRRQKAMVRELWIARDRIAQSLDLAPGRLLNDRVLVAIAKSTNTSTEKPASLKKFIRGIASDYLIEWEAALAKAFSLADEELPRTTRNEDAIPNPKSWAENFPEAFERWSTNRSISNELSAEIGISPEVLISPEILKRFCWLYKEELSEVDIKQALIDLGCREWAAELLAKKLSETNLESAQ